MKNSEKGKKKEREKTIVVYSAVEGDWPTGLTLLPLASARFLAFSLVNRRRIST